VIRGSDAGNTSTNYEHINMIGLTSHTLRHFSFFYSSKTLVARIDIVSLKRRRMT